MAADYANMYLFELETVKHLKAMELQYKMWSKQLVFVKNDSIISKIVSVL